jgi:hypothetical protein
MFGMGPRFEPPLARSIPVTGSRQREKCGLALVVLVAQRRMAADCPAQEPELLMELTTALAELEVCFEGQALHCAEAAILRLRQEDGDFLASQHRAPQAPAWSRRGPGQCENNVISRLGTTASPGIAAGSCGLDTGLPNSYSP